MIEHYAGGTLQAANELADLAHPEGDQRSRLRRPLLGDVTVLSFTRRAARKPKASMATRKGGEEAQSEHGHPQGGEEAQSEHGQRDVPVPAVPGADFVIGQADLLLGHLEASSMAQRRPATCPRVVRVVRSSPKTT